MNPSRAEAGSFRDPRGSVYVVDGRVFRTVMPSAAEDFDFVESTGLLERMAAAGRTVAYSRVDPSEIPGLADDAYLLLEHPRLPFISYPYEWSFSALKAAALLHLDIQIEALRVGVALSDATAYNVQFQGPSPIFIDTLSFRRYRDGEFWIGHRQFCEQFLNPLLLRSLLGVSPNNWYRGNLEGIPVADLATLLPWRKKLSWNVFTHVQMQAYFQRSASRGKAGAVSAERQLPLKNFLAMLQGLRNWISGLRPGGRERTVWSHYAGETSYSDDETIRKHAFVKEFIATTRPETVWDIGCNTGDYSKIALAAGARRVIGFDFDEGALDAAFRRAQGEELDLLPLLLDATNPSPDQGWAQAERMGLRERASADAILALALIHHLVIAKNVPLDQALDWLMEFAPSGVVEFVPKGDPMVQELLRLREDIFDRYDEEHFLSCVRSRAEILKSTTVSGSGRLLISYRRR